MELAPPPEANGTTDLTKLGLIYAPSASAWAKSHAYLPTPLVIDDDVLRVYFAALDEDHVGRIGYVDVDARDPRRILTPLGEPVLREGRRGTFDDAGVTATCVIDLRDRVHLYYFGWQRTVAVPYLLFGGVAVSTDKGRTFVRYRESPILDRSPEEPFGRSAGYVREDGGSFRMWYVSVVSWLQIGGRWLPSYVIRHLESRDGLEWKGHGTTCIDFEAPDEFGFGRPWVIRDGSTYRMWYSIRSRTRGYRAGYAESVDGLSWSRQDDRAGLMASAQGWDSEMAVFPALVDAGGQRYMFYNGNGHGRTGFGGAVVERDA